jgi:N-acetylglucosamine-6-phosphate deacetylase
LPTCISDTPEITAKAIAATREARKTHAGILGIHLEGPHLSAAARGVHKLDYIRPLTDNDLTLYRCDAGEVFLITVAPENVTPPQMRQMRESGVIISLGHTNAEPDQIRQAFEAGASGYTHLFNGMAKNSGMSGRAPGPVGVALDDQNCWCGIIADGYHVSPEMIRIAVRAKPPGKVFLVSDAMASSASKDPASFQLYGETIHVEKDRCTTGEGNLAGASITLSDAVRHCITTVGIEAEEVLRMASLYPAAFLGLDETLGKLLPGYAADVVALDGGFRLSGVWRAGKTVA